jgi:diguanylate cyclase (GGDEF)-like protein
MSRSDARLLEMQLLARLEREGQIEIKGPYDGSPERQMIISLIDQGYINERGSSAYPYTGGPTSGAGHYYLTTRAQQLDFLMSKREDLPSVPLYIGHRGRVRLSELQQQLKTGRDRDPTGLCVAKRHLLTDLAVALTSVDKATPLSVVFLDMNGLKVINDAHGHRAGDEAIRAYLEAVVATFGEHGEAYRGEGGDEAMVVLPNTSDEGAGKLLGTFVRQLGKDALVLGDAKTAVRLTASCGSASTTDPNEDAAAVLERSDKAQYRAKTESKRHDPRVSTIAVGDGEVTRYAP